jgi:transcriptional regulator with XRE-family HTH domain
MDHTKTSIEVEENIRSIVNQLTYQRKRLGLSQAELAGRVGMRQSGLSRIERHKSTPHTGTLGALSRELGMKLTLTEIVE